MTIEAQVLNAILAEEHVGASAQEVGRNIGEKTAAVNKVIKILVAAGTIIETEYLCRFTKDGPKYERRCEADRCANRTAGSSIVYVHADCALVSMIETDLRRIPACGES